jgi:fatty-acyl-CoA synthase
VSNLATLRIAFRPPALIISCWLIDRCRRLHEVLKPSAARPATITAPAPHQRMPAAERPFAREAQVTHPSVHARTTPDKVAYVMAESGRTLTYGELDRRSNQAANQFRSLGLQAGDHIALLMENSLDFLEICWGAQRSGLYFTPISLYLRAPEIAHVIKDSGARVLVVSPAVVDSLDADTLRNLPPDLHILVTGAKLAGIGSWHEAIALQPETPIADEVAGVDMLYSSGTTGRPKGVKRLQTFEPIDAVHPLTQLLLVRMLGMSAESIYLSPAPLYHAAPLRFAMAAVAFGGTVVVMEKFDAETLLRLIERHRVTHTQTVPTMFVRMLKLPEAVRTRYDISSLRAAVHAAAPCPAEVKEQMIAWWGPNLIEYYAGTEANGVTIISAGEWLTHRGSVGKALFGTVKIVDDSTGEELPNGQIGSVFFAGTPRFEYHNDPATTRAAFNDQGWSTIGDVGYLDDESYLYLTDRKAYRIISGGVCIYPQETEDALIGHQDVVDVAVFGVPNPEMGEEVKAVVQPVDPAAAGPEMEQRLIAYCRERLSPLACPRSIDFIDELPRTPTGKLLKRHLRDRYWPTRAEVTAAA